MSLAALKLSPRTHRRNRRRVRRLTSRRSVQELVWLNDIPVATIRSDQGGTSVGVFYIHTDHLNSPIKVTRPSDNAVIWRWDHDPYGNGIPNEDPDSNGAILVMNLRRPGQYYDQELDTAYNYYRDCYDAKIGQYCQSDPLGLAGGSFSTYTYVNGNPISESDPSGLDHYNRDRSRRGRDRPSYPRPPNPPSKPNDDPWPGGDDWRGQCIRLYAQCVDQQWSGDCGACLNKCTAQQEWPFEGPVSCSPQRRNNQFMCTP